jgi:hypothetical protein
VIFEFSNGFAARLLAGLSEIGNKSKFAFEQVDINHCWQPGMRLSPIGDSKKSFFKKCRAGSGTPAQKK